MNKFLQSTINNDHIYEKLTEIEELLKKPKVEKQLLTIQEVADFLGLSYDHTYSYIIKQKDFPNPVLIKGNGAKPKRMFLKEDVMNFIKKKREPQENKWNI